MQKSFHFYKNIFLFFSALHNLNVTAHKICIIRKEKTKMNEKFDWVRLASMIFCIAAGIAASYILFKYVFALVLPFLLGAGIGALACGIAGRLMKLTQASRRSVSVAVLLLLLCSLVGGVFLGVRRLVAELGRLAESIGNGDGRIAELFGEVSNLLSNISDRISDLFGNADGGEKAGEFIDGLIGNILSSLASAIPGFLTGIASALPDILLGLIVTVIAAFYFTLDGGKIRHGARALLPSSLSGMLGHIKKEAAIAAVGYLRSYSLILLITFAEIFFGLSVLGVEYSFLIAAITALIDILPVLGVGIVLIPWAIFCLLTRDLFLGIGLIILYVIIVIVRQFIEPKIVGESLGLHPLITLAAFYLGYRLFGFAGIIIAPLILIGWRALKSFGGVSSEQSSV